MRDFRENARISETIEQQTSVWLLRCDRGLSAAEQDDFLQWLAADRLHGECLTAQRRDWERLNLLAEWRPEHSARPNRDLLVPPPRRRVWFVPMISLAAAASIALGLFFVRSRPETRIANPNSETSIAVIRQHVFADGSIAELNRDAELTVLYTVGERRVSLQRGEVYFAVAKDPGRPFIVNANGVEVRAVGTAFNVRVDAIEVEVLVKEGKVKVAAPESTATSAGAAGKDPAIVSASERIFVPLTPSAAPMRAAAVTAEEMEHRLAWQPKMLDFTGASLTDIVEEFNRRNAPIKLVVADPVLSDLQ
ncbi:MAG: FecR family protein, partial [Opitutaceae bacterium]